MGRVTEAARAARRDQILAGALTCFARRGYHAATMGDVAIEAGVSKGTPYVYFPSKESLFLALYQEWDCGLADRIQAAVEEPDVRASNSPRRVLRAVVVAVGAHVNENSQACRVLMEASLMAADQPELGAAVQSAQARYEQSLAELVQAGVAAREWPPSTDPALEARPSPQLCTVSWAAGIWPPTLFPGRGSLMPSPGTGAQSTRGQTRRASRS
jgi:AcrR family transcriptional regulator